MSRRGDEADPAAPRSACTSCVAERLDRDRLQGVHAGVDDKSIVGQAVLSAQPINIPDLDRARPSPARTRGGSAQPQLRRQDRLPDALDADGADAVGARPRSSASSSSSTASATRPAAPRAGGLRRPGDRRSTSAPRSWRWRWRRRPASRSRTRCSTTRSSELFEGFVDASVTAIESRDPTTSGHSRRVATLSVGAGREGRRARQRAASRTCTSRRRRSSRSSTPACCTTSARSACARRCWSRPRSSTRTSAS